MNNMKTKLPTFKISIILTILIALICFGIETVKCQDSFIRVYSEKYFIVPPFPIERTEVSLDQRVSHRNILAPREKMNKEWLEYYDMWDTVPKIQKMCKADFDSIVDYIYKSGILKIDLSYTEPDPNLPRCFKSGACLYRYIIETKNGKLDLLISGAEDFKLPDILSKFDLLFLRITRKYPKIFEKASR